ncbi:MAG: DegV family protein [Clostridia bacterium]|nr:DegV family protein [Clostridia bacterium]
MEEISVAKKVILSADSACDLGEQLIKRYNVANNCLMHVVYGDKSYDDGADITPDEIYERFYKDGTLPKTAAISVGEYIDYFKPYIDEGYEVVHINLGSGLSCSHANACLAAEQLGGGVYPVDSQNLSTGIGLLVIEASEMISKGMEAAQVAEEIKAMVQKSHASFVLDTLKFLAAGGRCSSVVALGANLLQIKPSIVVDNEKGGAMTVGKKYRGKFDKRVADYVNDQLEKYGDDIRPERIFITHSGIYDGIADAVRKQLEKRGYFAEIFETRASCTISSHCGPNCIGILFLTK